MSRLRNRTSRQKKSSTRAPYRSLRDRKGRLSIGRTSTKWQPRGYKPSVTRQPQSSPVTLKARRSKSSKHTSERTNDRSARRLRKASIRAARLAGWNRYVPDQQPPYRKTLCGMRELRKAVLFSNRLIGFRGSSPGKKSKPHYIRNLNSNLQCTR